MKKFYLALDLEDDPEKIAAYKEHHQKVWPEILESLGTSGIISMQIFNIENRLFMVVETIDDFSFEKKALLDRNNTRVQDWETLMWTFQKAIPNSKEGEKWRLMEEIFYYKK